jgi:hypothetical protein
VYAALDAQPLFPVGSKVHLPTRTAFVMSLNGFDSGSLALGLDHLQVALT